MSEDTFCYSNWGWGAIEAKDAAKYLTMHEVLPTTDGCSSTLPERCSPPLLQKMHLAHIPWLKDKLFPISYIRMSSFAQGALPLPFLHQEISPFSESP